MHIPNQDTYKKKYLKCLKQKILARNECTEIRAQLARAYKDIEYLKAQIELLERKKDVSKSKDPVYKQLPSSKEVS